MSYSFELKRFRFLKRGLLYKEFGFMKGFGCIIDVVLSTWKRVEFMYILVWDELDVLFTVFSNRFVKRLYSPSNILQTLYSKSNCFSFDYLSRFVKSVDPSFLLTLTY